MRISVPERDAPGRIRTTDPRIRSPRATQRDPAQAQGFRLQPVGADRAGTVTTGGAIARIPSTTGLLASDCPLTIRRVPDDELLRSIDAKLSAILVLTLDGYLRETGVARPKERSVDKMLSDIGLSARQIAALLGKTDRAVNLQLQRESKRKAQKKGS